MGDFDRERRVTKEFKHYRDFCRSAVNKLRYHPLTSVRSVSETSKKKNTVTEIRCEVHLPQGKQNITVFIPYRELTGQQPWTVQGKKSGREVVVRAIEGVR